MALGHLAQALLDLGDPALLDEAESHCRLALEIGPEQAPLLCTLGEALRLRGRPEDAMASFHRALLLEPHRWSVLDSVARLLNEHRRGSADFGIANQLPVLFDGRAATPGNFEATVTGGNVGRCTS